MNTATTSLLFLTCCITFAIISAEGNVDPDTIIEPNIIGGEKALIKDVPYIALLGGCGGSIIASRWILTAGHCRDPKEVYVGSAEFGKGKRYNVQAHYLHPEYDDVVEPLSDFKLLYLEEHITFNENVSSIALGTEDDIRAGGIATVSGWGRDDTGTHPIYLRTVDVEIIDESVCRQLYGELVNDSTFCAGVGGQDSCDGDSGGPIIANNKLIGVVSFGQACGDDVYPGVYAKVPYAREWIRSVTGV